MSDILERLKDVHHQATVERSHYYTGAVIKDAIEEILRLRAKLIAVHHASGLTRVGNEPPLSPNPSEERT